MVKHVRRNSRVLGYLRALVIASATFVALVGLSFQPLWGAIALALGAGALALVATDLGIITAVIAISLPIAASNPVIGIIFLVLGIASIRYLAFDGGQIFTVIASGVAGAFLGPAWLAAVIAGYMLGMGEGAIAAALAALSIQAIGLLAGREQILTTLTGGSGATRALDFSSPPENLLSFGWLSESISGLSIASANDLTATLAQTSDVAALVIQPLLWAGAAITAGMLTQLARKKGRQGLIPLGIGVAAFVPAVGVAITFPTSGLDADWQSLAMTAGSSALIGAVFVIAAERFFSLQVVRDDFRRDSMAVEDADVDELLRLISTAEDRLATKHTTQGVVMITDMKSFSKMTEEDGSVLTAKAIQMHRDLLLPIIEANRGRGKPTGGDGLVAAFADPASALRAGAEVQRTLEAHNRAHPEQRAITVRIGIAQGEVVLDKGGRPFIGSALNLAARVMNLADGGQTFCAADIVADAPGAVPTHPHGTFELKNIAIPVDVIEVLWADGQNPAHIGEVES